jgi:hypothetical protein
VLFREHVNFHYSRYVVEVEFYELRVNGVLRSSAHSWYSDVFCAMAHIHSPQAGVCCARCVASAVPREGAGQLSAFLLLEAGTL